MTVVVSGGFLLFLQATQAADKEPSPKPELIMPKPLTAQEKGFVFLFDGKTLKGWEGDPIYWRVENGYMVGEITPKTVLKDRNSFIIWRGGTPKDFELKLQYRISPEGNSGVNYRSEELSEPRWALRGYQFDIDGANWGQPFAAALKKWGIKVPSSRSDSGMAEPGESLRITGQNYEERGRQFLALPGLFTQIDEGDTQRVIGYVDGEHRVEDVARAGWNDVQIIARGNLLIHMLNGHVMSMVADDDRKNRRMNGKLGMQVHSGPPMKVEFRNIRLKTLEPAR